MRRQTPTPGTPFTHEPFPMQTVAASKPMVAACMNLFRASELWGARMGTFLAQALPEPALRAEALRHTAEEIRHTYLFDERIREIGGRTDPVPPQAIYLVCCAEAGIGLSVARVEGPPDPLLSDEECIRLFAGIHVIEQRGTRMLREFAHAFPVGDPTRQTFETVMHDEATHAASGIDVLERYRNRGLGGGVDSMLEKCRATEPEAWGTFLQGVAGYLTDVLADGANEGRLA